MSNCPNCPNCNSAATVKSGKPQGRQRYGCKNCGRYFIYAPHLADVADPSTDSNLNVKRQEIGLSLLGISLGLITTTFLLVFLFGFVLMLGLDLKLQPQLPHPEKQSTP